MTHSYMCDMTNLDVTHSFVPVPPLLPTPAPKYRSVHMCGVTHSCVRHESFICDLTNLDVTHSFVSIPQLLQTPAPTY